MFRALLGLLAAATLLASCTGQDQAPPAGTTASSPTPVDGCMACHSAREGAQGSHHADQVGCASCHLGDPTATDQDSAHVGLELEPGALDSVARTCGAAGCHPAQAERVRGSMMATAAGLVAVDRWAMGELAAPHGHQAMAELLAVSEPTPGEDHVRRLCGGCHLGTRKANRDDAVQGTGSGCSACHSASRAGRFEAHPTVDLVVPDDRCLGCHSRSGRISLSYQGLAEAKGVDCEQPVTLHDGRPGCRRPADLHHDAGLSCTDCHLHTELMGDGVRWSHEEQATELRCESCHGPGAPESTWATVSDDSTRALLRLHGQQRAPEDAVRTGLRGTPIWNLVQREGRWLLQPKGGGDALAVTQTPADPTHQQAGHERLSCSACHTRWVPSCPDCHTAYDPDGSQWDFGAAAEAEGAWVEQSEHFGWSSPALGVRPGDRIGPVMPGMIWSLDASAAGGPVLQARRYAAAESHTTVRQGRDCASCHRSAWALGLGSGSLDLQALRFTPTRSADDAPGLAVDGWVSLQPDQAGQGTRPALRSLDAAEQQRVLRVGLCLDCHDASSPVYADFAAAVARLAAGLPGCSGTLPAWASPAD